MFTIYFLKLFLNRTDQPHAADAAVRDDGKPDMCKRAFVCDFFFKKMFVISFQFCLWKNVFPCYSFSLNPVLILQCNRTTVKHAAVRKVTFEMTGVNNDSVDNAFMRK